MFMYEKKPEHSIKILNFLISQNVDMNTIILHSQYGNNITILYYAIYINDFEIVEILLNHDNNLILHCDNDYYLDRWFSSRYDHPEKLNTLQLLTKQWIKHNSKILLYICKYNYNDILQNLLF